MWAGGKQGGLAAEWSSVSAAASPPHSPTMISQDDHPGSRGAAVHGRPSATLGAICCTRPTALEATVPGGKPASHIRRAGLTVQRLTSLSSSSLEHYTSTSTCRGCSRLIQQTCDWQPRCCGVEHREATASSKRQELSPAASSQTPAQDPITTDRTSHEWIQHTKANNLEEKQDHSSVH